MLAAENASNLRSWRSTLIRLAHQITGAMLWGAFIAVAPFEILFFGGWIVWLPLLIWRERIRTRRYGFWPGAVARFAVATSIVVAAIAAPKDDDRIVGPVSYENLPLHDLCADLSWNHHVPVRAWGEADFRNSISFSTSISMTRRQLVQGLARATNREAKYWGCLSGGSFLFGHSGAFHLCPRQETPAPVDNAP
jgi:hypothetical protein